MRWRRLCGIELPEQVRLLRRLVYCGEWIESHVLPHGNACTRTDFLGYAGASSSRATTPARRDGPAPVKKAGNTVMDVIGGRAVHRSTCGRRHLSGARRAPSSTRSCRSSSGPARRRSSSPAWWRRSTSPTTSRTTPLRRGCAPGRVRDRARQDRLQHGSAISTSPSTSSTSRRRTWSGRTRSTRRSRASATTSSGRSPATRLSSASLSPLAREVAAEVGLGTSWHPFRSIVVRAVETVYAADEALRIIAQYEPPEPSFIPAAPRAGTGHGCTEARAASAGTATRSTAEGTILDVEDRAADVAEPEDDRG